MKLVAQIASKLVPGLFVLLGLYFLTVALMNANQNADSPIAVKTLGGSVPCSDPAVKSAAADKLADWLNQNVGKDNPYHIHGSFIAQLSSSVALDGLQGIQRCFAVVSLGIRPAGASSIIGPEPFDVHFRLDADQDGKPQVTMDKADLTSDFGAFDVGASLLQRQAMQSVSSTP
jgi:hypothetical protein